MHLQWDREEMDVWEKLLTKDDLFSLTGTEQEVMPSRHRVLTVNGWTGTHWVPDNLTDRQAIRMLSNRSRAIGIRHRNARMTRFLARENAANAEREARQQHDPQRDQEDAIDDGDGDDDFQGFGDDDVQQAEGRMMDFDQQAMNIGNAGTGGGNAAQTPVEKIAAPIYKNIKAGPMQFTKRWHFLLPVFCQFLIGTSLGTTTRKIFYCPTIFDFDPNRYGFYFAQSDLDWLGKLNKTANAIVKRIKFNLSIDNANCPFNTNGATQQSANSQLHIKMAKQENANRLGPSVTGTAVYTSPTTGPYTVGACAFDGTLPNNAAGQANRLNAFAVLEQGRTADAGTNINTTNGIINLTQPDATEGYRFYPFVHLWEASWDNTTKIVSNYPEFNRAMDLDVVGKGQIWHKEAKKNHLMFNQFYDQRPSAYPNNTVIKPVIGSSYAITQSEQPAQLAGVTAVPDQGCYMLDDNFSQIGNPSQGVLTKSTNSLQLQLMPPPTTTDSLTTTQAGYLAVTLDCEADVLITRDHIMTTNNAAAGGTLASQFGMVNKFNENLGAQAAFGIGLGNGVTAFDKAGISKWGPANINSRTLVNV